MKLSSRVLKMLKALANAERAQVNAWFFKTGPGQYGEGDRFLGVTMPELRRVVKSVEGDANTGDAAELLASPLHEVRMPGALLLVSFYKKAATERERARLYKFYLSFVGHGINNWDLVDVTAEHIVGAHTFSRKNLAALESLCRHKNMWKRRVGIVATLYWSRQGDAHAATRCAEILLKDKEDLMHKASGWMLREMGKRVGLAPLRAFLTAHAQVMPRTMLRYAIERLSPVERHKWMTRKNT